VASSSAIDAPEVFTSRAVGLRFVDVPDTRYARNGDVSIAYQVLGSGPDLVFLPSSVSQVEHLWAEPRLAQMLERLASFSRLILFDRRGSGLSDRIEPGPLEVQVDLVPGSQLEFEPRGTRELKGVPGDWQLYAAA
jgi:pimeloyl-ACP methyl ester carboxylesterase